MNTFRTISRVLVVTAVIVVCNTTAIDLDSIAGPLTMIVNNQNVKPVITAAVGIAGGLILKEQLVKQNPLAIAVVSGLGSAAVDGGKAGIITTGVSLALSGVRAVVPEIEAVEKISDKLPEFLTSKEAMLVAQAALAVAVGHYLGAEKK